MDGERKKREKKGPSSKSAAFEKLKAVKSGGKKNKYEVAPLENVYEEVSEKEYTETVLKRQEDDWIVGDYAAEGYVEDGREIFDDDLDEESIRKNQKTKKRDRTANHKNVEPPKGNLEKMFKNMPAKRKREVKLEEDDILGSLMEELDSPSLKVAKKEVSSHDGRTAMKKDTFQEVVPSPVAQKNLLPFEIDELENCMFTEAVGLAQAEKEAELIALKDLVENEACTEARTSAVLEKTVAPVGDGGRIESEICTAAVLTAVSDREEDICVKALPVENTEQQLQKFFYWDAYEDPYNQPGTVFLFGKIWVESAKTYASCCVMVKNICRKLYFLPRETKNVKLIDVYNEFNEKIAEKLNVMKFKSRKLTKHYAFDMRDVPDTCEYLEIQYPATDPALPTDLTGETFSRVFGNNTSSLETFLLDRKIKGPSWLAISHALPAKINFSWCKFELICENPSSISVLTDGTPPPPLVVMSLNIRITPLPKTHENQITMIGWLVHNEYRTDRAAPSPQFKDHFCAFTKPTEVMFPVDTKSSKEELAKLSSTNLEKLNSERALLALFLAKFHKIDPDLIVGHDIYGFDVGTLIHRIVTNKIPHWSRIGRLRRQEFPKTSKGKNFVERNLMCGRLLCDVQVSAKELIRARSYDLTSLCELVLHLKEGERKEIKAEIIKDMYSSSELLAGFIKVTMSDALYVLRIMYDLNVIPLSLQITNIAGNVMSRTLMGGRSERNEYLLLHAFYEKGYIVPDKAVYGKKKEEENEVKVASKGKRKPQYEGGLVLEPKTGFYDKFILLMDFNSLYPSIIQEFNICFTTISVRGIQLENEGDVMKLMKYLPSAAEPGILPTEIKKLVESRRQVKALMKKSDLPPDLRHQYDIRQLALKLTANSMYGCLGFPNSRFYAKPLAAMITAKGREILLNTRDLVQRLNYDVIYGDTDSLMINTNVVDYDEVFNIGKKIKMEVNKLYKQIELDIDGVFKYILLLKKKKYAAVTVSKVNGKLILKQEIKGLDVVRRDWSQLSAEAGKFVLQQILSDQNLDDKLARILAHLEKLKTDLEEERVPISLLAITKQLTKNPEEYPDKKSLPHVQVALRMNTMRTKKFKQGDAIAYVICQDGTSNVALQRAYHVDEFKAKDDLAIDVNYYLSQQIHPVVSRLCELIDGIDAVRIADSLGLDTAAYQTVRRLHVANDNDDEDISTDKALMYKNCESFQFSCPNEDCRKINSLDAPCVKNDNGNLEFVLSRCANRACHLPPYEYVSRLQNKLWLTMREYVHKYYQRWLVCEERSCSYRSRNIVAFNKKFEAECPQCGRNILVTEFTEAQLYLQLCFFHYIFDHTSFMSQHKELKLDVKSPLAMAYSKLKDAVDVMLAWSSYNAVSLGRFNRLMAMK